jgi:hypothetical protein
MFYKCGICYNIDTKRVIKQLLIHAVLVTLLMENSNL